MSHQYHLTRISSNSKLGGLPASTTSSDSCPVNCSFRDGGGCYGDGGPISLHWKAVNRRDRGVDLDTFCAQVKMLPRHQLWRHNQVGDLPGDGERIDSAALAKIVKANLGKHGFTFTHYSPYVEGNAAAIAKANRDSFAVNLSAETLEQVDAYVELGIAPVVTVLPADAKKAVKTPAGNRVVPCPATVRDDVTCAQCAMCSNPLRDAVIGFPAHGRDKAKVESIFWAQKA